MKIIDLVHQNEVFRTENLNMIVSENVLSPKVKQALAIQHSRYHADFYGGTKIFKQIYTQTQSLAKDIFRCKSAIISPLSGNMAVVAAILAFTNPKDKIAILPLSPAGGYPINIEYFNRIRVNIPFSQEEFNIDLPQALKMLSQEKPKLVFLGSSLFLFPHPVRSIANIVHEYGGIIAYDGSHVLGLIAGEQFQDPLNEGADVLLGSTHKSFPGPQGGIIVSNTSYEEFEDIVGVEPLKGIVLVDNIHNSRVAALGVSFEEFKEYGRDYAHQVIKNSKTLAHSLDSYNIPLHGKEKGFTESHQVLMKIQDFNEGAKFRDILMEYRIVTDAGMRLGTAELTRLGFHEKEFKILGNIIGKILHQSSKSLPLELQEIKTIQEEIETLITYTKQSHFKG
ncbi:MAG: aminotransferase class I/II-fold pyridoxal phosphate-dependent enzyme [Candidatus Hodarchaeota archaeon]